MLEQSQTLKKGRGVKINLRSRNWMSTKTLKHFGENIFFQFNQKYSQIKVIILYISVVLNFR